MSLPTASAAIGIAFIASTGVIGFTSASDPVPVDPTPRAVAVRVASVDPGFQASLPGMQVSVVPAALPVPTRMAATDAEPLPARRGTPASLTPSAAPAPAAAPAGPSGLQPVQGPAMKWPAPPPSASQPVPPAANTKSAPRPQSVSAPAQSPQRMTAPQPVPMPRATSTPAPGATPAQATTTMPGSGGMARQVHGFDGIVASERALLQRTAMQTRYEAHIASTSTAAEAEAMWADLRAKLGDRHAGATMQLKVIEVPQHGRFVRLLAGEFNDAGSTADFCRAVIAAGKDCRILRKLETAG